MNHMQVQALSEKIVIPVGIIDSDKKKFDFYNDKSLIGTVKKIKKFWSDLSENDKNIIVTKIKKSISNNSLPITGMAIIGTTEIAVGAAVASVNPLKGACLAASGCAHIAIGLAVGTIFVVVDLKNSSKLELIKKWKESEQGEYGFFERIIAGDPRFDRLKCGINHKLIHDPVMAPNGVLYERSAIQSWLFRKNEELKEAIESKANIETLEEIKKNFCPLRSGYFTKENLVKYKKYNLDLEKLLKTKISELQENLENDLAYECLNALRKVCVQERENEYHMSCGIIHHFCKENNLPMIISTNAQDAFYYLYKKDIEQIDAK